MNFSFKGHFVPLLEDFFKLSGISAKAAYEAAHAIYYWLSVGLVTIIVLTFAMWLANIAGGMGFNLFIFFLGTFIIPWALWVPKAHLFAALGGIAWNKEINPKKIPDAAMQGINTLHDIVIRILFCFQVLTGLLSTWSFSESPGSFWVIAAMAIMLLVTFRAFNFGSHKLFAKIVVAYSIVIMIGAFGETLPSDDDGGNNTPPPAGSQTANVSTQLILPLPSDSKYFTVPPKGHGSAIVQRDNRSQVCATDTIGPNHRYVDRIPKATHQEYVSTANVPIEGRVRFYKKIRVKFSNGQTRTWNCEDTEAKLIADGLLS